MRRIFWVVILNSTSIADSMLFMTDKSLNNTDGMTLTNTTEVEAS